MMFLRARARLHLQSDDIIILNNCEFRLNINFQGLKLDIDKAQTTV